MDKVIKLPLISVIMPVYNCADFVAEAIESILNQTFLNLELIIIDDNSTDKTKQVIKGYRDKRITLILKEENSGLIHSLNLGIMKAGGQYIARMDGDDICDLTRLEEQLNYFHKHPECILCGTACRILGNDQLIQFPVTHDEIKLSLLEHCPLVHPTVMFKKDFFYQNGLFYAKEFEWAEDYELWSRAVWLGQFANLRVPLLFYRQHPNQVTQQYKQKQDLNSAICRVNMLRKVWPAASAEDIFTRTLLFQDVPFRDIFTLNTVLKWMDDLVRSNVRNRHFDPSGFDSYIDLKKRAAVRRFFLNETRYNPIIFYDFLRNLKSYKRCFSMTEHLKLGLKCLVFKA